ncbi:hypothetical protein V8G61_08880 [Gaetbulibacter sp. M240]|uniref:hypothetical protein n=1 Tax=Gaetbulibacter sp. M240 TaxID=3126511 RepID=UPI00374F78D2
MIAETLIKDQFSYQLEEFKGKDGWTELRQLKDLKKVIEVVRDLQLLEAKEIGFNEFISKKPKKSIVSKNLKRTKNKIDYNQNFKIEVMKLFEKIRELKRQNKILEISSEDNDLLVFTIKSEKIIKSSNYNVGLKQFNVCYTLGCQSMFEFKQHESIKFDFHFPIKSIKEFQPNCFDWFIDEKRFLTKYLGLK